MVFNWFWSYVTFKRGARLITARSDLDDPRPDPFVIASPALAEEAKFEDSVST